MFKHVLITILALFWFAPASAQDKFAPSYRAVYNVTFEADWSAGTHPTSFPSSAHWSGLVGATHNQQAHLWETGQLATPGIKRMAETGAKGTLLDEVDSLIMDGTAEFPISGPGIARSPGTASVVLDISQSFPLVSLTSMIAPSPDWFVGVDSLNLRSGRQWRGEVVIDLLPYDAGTDSGASFQSANLPSNPAEPITAYSQSPLDSGVPLGRFRFELMGTEGLFPIAGHQSGWYHVPTRSGEGINFNVARAGDRLFVSVAWFTYIMGEQMWLIGSADIAEGDDVATVEVISTSGTDFGDGFNADDVIREVWGTITVSHPACGLMIVDYDGGLDFGTGQLLMEQIVNVAGLECG